VDDPLHPILISPSLSSRPPGFVHRCMDEGPTAFSFAQPTVAQNVHGCAIEVHPIVYRIICSVLSGK
jgi:hypothetical protein